MSLWKRLTRIGRANVNAALDKMEDPVKMIDQVLRELDEDLATVTAAVTTQVAVEKRFERELLETEKIIEKREQQARRALENGEETLARQALKDKKNQTEKREKILVHYEKAKASADKLRRQLQNMKDRIQEMKTQKSTLIAQTEAARASKKINDTMNGLGSNDLGATFARMEEKIHQMHDEADAARELADEGRSLDEKFEDMLRDFDDHDIDDELAALKSEIQTKSE